MNGNIPLTIPGTPLAEFFYLIPNKPALNWGVILPKVPAYCFVPGNNQLNSRVFRVVAGGDFKFGAGAPSSPTITLGLYPATFTNSLGTNSDSNVTIGPAVISQTFPGADVLYGSYPWALSVEVVGDSASGVVQSLKGAISIDGTGGSFSAANILTNINMNTPCPFAFCLGMTLTLRDAAAVANVYEFYLDY